MHRRFLFPLAAGVVSLVAISPALAGPSTPAGKGNPTPAKATTSTTAKSGRKGAGATTTTTAASDGSTATTSPPPNGSTATTAPSSDGSTATTAPSSDGSTATTAPPSGGTTATTAPPSGGTGGAPGSTSSCAPPQTDQGPAPQVGEPPQNHAAGDAGTVDIERLSPSELRIAKVNANSGWQETVTSPSGPRVTVKFTRSGASPTLIRLAASMDQAGRMIHIRVQSCG
ncbi:MAG TPA: hypothetical protein VHL53_08450 [Acidimicrobiia bacterium]|nr:hypothetical protein [Acidimicrobiia bacterium]